MFQIDEKVIADSRTLITIQNKKEQIDPLVKNGTLNYTMDKHNLWLTTPKVKSAYLKRADHTDNYDKVVLARNGVNIDGTYEFDDDITFNQNVDIKKDLVVRGNFTVEGNSSIVDTPRLSIEDNIIELNRNEEGNGITLRRAGSAINRGQKEFARTLYDEVYRAFVFDTNSDMEGEVQNDKWVAMAFTEKIGSNVAGEFKVRQKVSAPFATFSDSLTVLNRTHLNHLDVDGNSTFHGPIVANGDHTVNGLFTANGNAVFNNLLTANKVATFNDSVVMKKTLSVDGLSTFNDLVTFNKGINVTSAGASITGPVSITGTLRATDNVTFSKDLTVGSTASTNALNVSTLTMTDTLTVKSNAVVQNNLNVNNNLVVDGSTTLNAATTINAPFRVNNDSVFTGNITIQNKNLVINSNGDNNGTLTVGGHAYFEKTLNVTGNALFNGEVTITNGPLTMNNSDIVARNITTKNDFKVESGEGKGLRFWDNDNYKIYMSSTGHATGGRMDSTSDYNMYFKMSTGTNRGFVFKNENTPLVQIEGSGQMRTKEKIIAHGFDVITRENEGHKTDATGINADKLDGLHDYDFLRRNVDTNTTASIEFKTAGKAIKFNGGGEIFRNGAVIVKASNAINDGVKIQTEAGTDLLSIKDNVVNGLLYKGKKVWHEHNQGHNSGLDADTLDGKHKEFFATADHLHDDRYIRNDEVNLRGKYKIEYNEEFDSLDFMYMGDTP